MMEKQTNRPTHKVVALLEKPQVRVFFGLLALGLAYVFISWAIDSGSLLDYAIAILLAISGGRELLDAFRIYRKGQGRRR